MYKIRFHLGRGDDFMKWQVKTLVSDGTDIVQYFEPEKYQLAMFDAKLKVQLGTSKKIHEGACKTVCAWVECDMVDVHYKKDPAFSEVDTKNLRKYKYNPKKNIHWFTSKQDNVDNKQLVKMHTNSRALYGRVN